VQEIIRSYLQYEQLQNIFKRAIGCLAKIPPSVKTRVTSFVGFESDILMANRLQTNLVGKGTAQGQTIKFNEIEYSLEWASESQIRMPPIAIGGTVAIDPATVPRGKPSFMVKEEMQMDRTSPLVELRESILRCHRLGCTLKQVDDTYNLAVTQWMMEQ